MLKIVIITANDDSETMEQNSLNDTSNVIIGFER